MREVVTLQVGRQSNFLATHFWNTQEFYFAPDVHDHQDDSPIDHDRHFRQGFAPDGSDTYTPRTVIYDFKHEFGTLRRINELYDVLEDQTSDALSWSSNAVTQRLPAIVQNEYQRNLELGNERPPLTVNDVRFWSDYNRVFYHPRSIVQVYETDVTPGMRSFDEWPAGEELFSTLDREHDLLDRDLRPFVEECDQMQGIQLISSVENAWGAFSAKYLDRLRDEYGKIPIWTWALDEPVQVSRPASRLRNTSRALLQLASQSTVYVPCTPCPSILPAYVSIDSNSPWHTSALQATAFESVTLPARLHDSLPGNSSTLDQLAETINLSGGKPIASLSYSIEPESANPDRGLEDHAKDIELSNWRSRRQSKIYAELRICRGNTWHVNGLDSNGSAEQNALFRRFTSTLKFPILDSFPNIFSLTTTAKAAVSVKAALVSSSSIGPWIQDLENRSRRLFTVDEREEVMNGLAQLRESYEGPRSDSEDDWED